MYKHLTQIRERNLGFRYLNSVKISFPNYPARANMCLEQVRSLWKLLSG